MQGEVGSDRGWEQWPGRHSSDEGGRSRLRALFLPSEATETAAVELAATHGREVEERLAAVRDSVAELEARERAVSELEAGVQHMLRAGSVELDRFQFELESRAESLDARERTLSEAESAVEERRRELGAVELKRAALEQRSEGLAEREAALEQRADELAALAGQLQELGERISEPEEAEDEATAHLLLTSDNGYRIVTADGAPPAVGDRVELDGLPYRCIRASRSPYPADPRPCAVLERADDEPVPGYVGQESPEPGVEDGVAEE